MALDFYNIEVTKSLFALEHSDYDIIYDVINDFYAKTGVYIDNYGGATLVPEHLQLLADLLEQWLTEQQKDNIRYPRITELQVFLRSCVKEEKTVIAGGD